jgi:hypothetical protein
LIEEIKKHINTDENKNLLLSSNANCISFNERYLSKICEVVIDKNKINCNLNITIGNIYKNGKEKIHCWITFNTGEILDLTLLTTNAFSEKKEIGLGDILYGAPDKKGMLEGYNYVPIFFGSDYLWKSGIIQPI